MLAAALSLALLSGLWPHHKTDAHHKPGAHGLAPRGRAGDWRYEVKTDPSTGEKHCALSGRDRASKVAMTYFNGVVAFRFAHVDVEDAVYQVDDGEPRASLNQADGNLGWVFLPAVALAHARQILVRPAPKLAATAVGVSHLDDALAATAALGCTPAAFPQPELTD